MTVDPRAVTDLDREIGARLRERRQELKLSMAYVAEAVGVSFQQLQKYEAGLNRVAAATLVNLAQALRVDPIDILPGRRAPKRRAPPEDMMAVQLQRAFARLPSQRERRLVLDLTRRLSEGEAKPAKKRAAKPR
jgi:transcriptional regulator with XRE-family HTH domain